MIVKTEHTLNIRFLLSWVIVDRFPGVTTPEDLDDRQCHLAYEAVKKHINRSARSLDEYDEHISTLKDLLNL